MRREAANEPREEGRKEGRKEGRRRIGRLLICKKRRKDGTTEKEGGGRGAVRMGIGRGKRERERERFQIRKQAEEIESAFKNFFLSSAHEIYNSIPCHVSRVAACTYNMPSGRR
jgi:hypothetical protein